MTDSPNDRPGGAQRPRSDHAAEPGDRASQAEHAGTGRDGLLAVIANLSKYHREHEKYYSEAPLADAIALQRSSRTLIALAERWATVEPTTDPVRSPFAGAPDLNDERAIETSGVLFMEGEGRACGDHPDQDRPSGSSGERRATWLVVVVCDGGLLGYRRSTAFLSGARGSAGRASSHHRQRLAKRINVTADCSISSPCRCDPGPSRFHTSCTTRGPSWRTHRTRLSLFRRGADQPRRRSLGRKRDPGPRQRAPVAGVPRPRGKDQPSLIAVATSRRLWSQAMQRLTATCERGATQRLEITTRLTGSAPLES